MFHTRNLITIAVAAVFSLTCATSVFAADTATNTKESGQTSGHGDMKSGDHHGHQCPHKMSSADQNKDGKISKEEFIKHHEAMFDKKDTNKDGFLDDTEMHGMKDHAHKHDHQKDADTKK